MPTHNQLNTYPHLCLSWIQEGVFFEALSKFQTNSRLLSRNVFPLSRASVLSGTEGPLKAPLPDKRQQLLHEEKKKTPQCLNNLQTRGCTCTQTHIFHTVLVCAGSVESAVDGVCVALVSIMLSFSVPLLGSSLRLPLRQQNLHLRLTDI